MSDRNKHDDDNVVDKALANLPRNDHDEVDEEKAIAFIAPHIEIDVAAEQRRKALQMLAARRKPGSSKPDGQLRLDGVDWFDYEPDRLVLDEDAEDGGRYLVENSRALVRAKNSEAERTMRKVRQAIAHAERRQAESSAYTRWAIPLIEAGEKNTDLPFGRFVHDSGAWVPTPAPSSSSSSSPSADR